MLTVSSCYLFLVSSLLFLFIGSVRQIKLAVRPLLGARKCSVSYRIVSYRIVSYRIVIIIFAGGGSLRM